jgi:hypothetical protein
VRFFRGGARRCSHRSSRTTDFLYQTLASSPPAQAPLMSAALLQQNRKVSSPDSHLFNTTLLPFPRNFANAPPLQGGGWGLEQDAAQSRRVCIPSLWPLRFATGSTLRYLRLIFFTFIYLNPYSKKNIHPSDTAAPASRLQWLPTARSTSRRPLLTK